MIFSLSDNFKHESLLDHPPKCIMDVATMDARALTDVCHTCFFFLDQCFIYNRLIAREIELFEDLGESHEIGLVD